MRYLIGLSAAAIIMGGGAMLIHLGIYGLSLFLLIPVLLGAISAFVYRPATAGRGAEVGAAAVMIASLMLLGMGMEGLICVVMSWPLALPLGALGGWMAFRAANVRLTSGSVAMLILLPTAGVTWDVNAKPPLFDVRTSIEIAATPEQVWKHVVTFSDLEAPQEWYFRAGLAYPMRARIAGSGPGAVRYCEFSTGPFVEPIQIWEEPRLLRFSVTENPAPMHEWSPYAQVLPKHLNGYLVSKQGQFLLTPMPNGHTLLEGTTWYQHGLWPAKYWRWWSDAIIHRIHLRVLNHIRNLSEA